MATPSAPAQVARDAVAHPLDVHLAPVDAAHKPYVARVPGLPLIAYFDRCCSPDEYHGHPTHIQPFQLATVANLAQSLCNQTQSGTTVPKLNSARIAPATF